MPEVPPGEVVLDGERRRQQVELVEPPSRLGEVHGHVVSVPELGLEIGYPLVVDHEARGRQGLEALIDRRGILGDVVRPLLHRREPDALARDAQEHDVRERAYEHRVARLQRILGRLVELVERGGVGAARGAPESLRILGVEHVEDEVGVRDVVDEHEVVGFELLADRPHPLLVRRRGRGAPDGVPAHRASLSGRQRNRSRSRGMTRSPPDPSPDSRRPRTIAAGMPSVFPITSCAAPAISSATAICVACSS